MKLIYLKEKLFNKLFNINYLHRDKKLIYINKNNIKKICGNYENIFLTEENNSIYIDSNQSIIYTAFIGDFIVADEKAKKIIKIFTKIT